MTPLILMKENVARFVIMGADALRAEGQLIRYAHIPRIEDVYVFFCSPGTKAVRLAVVYGETKALGYTAKKIAAFRESGEKRKWCIELHFEQTIVFYRNKCRCSLDIYPDIVFLPEH